MNCPICNENGIFYVEHEGRNFEICNKCDLLFTNDQVMYKDVFSLDYIKNYTEFTCNFLFFSIIVGIMKNIWDKKFQKEEEIPTPKVIDVGCGVGFLLHMVKNLGWDAKGVEPNIGESNWGIKNLGLDIFQKYLADCSIEANSQDFVVSLEVVEHTSDPIFFLKSLKNILSPKGFLILTTPNLRAKQLGTNADDPKFIQNKGKILLQTFHSTLFSKNSLELILHKVGFNEVFVSNYYGDDNDERLVAIASIKGNFSIDKKLLDPPFSFSKKLLLEFLENNYKKLSKESPFWEGVLSRLISIYSNTGEFKKANDVAEELLKHLDENNISQSKLLIVLDEILNVEKEMTKQLEYLKKIPAYFPDVLWNISLNYMNLNMHEQAFNMLKDLDIIYRKLLQLPNPDNYYSYFTSIFNRTERLENQQKLLRIVYHKGLTLLNTERRQEAINCFNEVLESKLLTNSEDLYFEAIYSKGVAFHQMGKFHSAILNFEKLITSSNSIIRTNSKFLMGLSKKYLGDKNESLKIFDGVLEDEDINQELKERIISEKKDLI